MSAIHYPFPELKEINESLFKACGLILENIEAEEESQDYSACSIRLKGITILYRQAKSTPKKIGQFVTVWKRNKQGVTEPHHLSDAVDFFVIASVENEKLGVFIFPKNLLHQQKVLSDPQREGKRGIRVYRPWDIAANPQAKKTQRWQTPCFVDLSPMSELDLAQAKQLLNLAPR